MSVTAMFTDLLIFFWFLVLKTHPALALTHMVVWMSKPSKP